MTGRVLGIDHGHRRVGLAITDPLRTIARPLEAIRIGGEKDLLARLGEVVREQEVVEIVLGLPVNMDGTEGPRAEAMRALAGRMTEALGVPVHLQDERWTSQEADRLLRQAEARGERRKRLQDPLAAQIILQTHLDRASSAASEEASPGDERPE